MVCVSSIYIYNTLRWKDFSHYYGLHWLGDFCNRNLVMCRRPSLSQKNEEKGGKSFLIRCQTMMMMMAPFSAFSPAVFSSSLLSNPILFCRRRVCRCWDRCEEKKSLVDRSSFPIWWWRSVSLQQLFIFVPRSYLRTTYFWRFLIPSSFALRKCTKWDEQTDTQTKGNREKSKLNVEWGKEIIKLFPFKRSSNLSKKYFRGNDDKNRRSLN